MREDENPEKRKEGERREREGEGGLPAAGEGRRWSGVTGWTAATRRGQGLCVVDVEARRERETVEGLLVVCLYVKQRGGRALVFYVKIVWVGFLKEIMPLVQVCILC